MDASACGRVCVCVVLGYPSTASSLHREWMGGVVGPSPLHVYPRGRELRLPFYAQRL